VTRLGVRDGDPLVVDLRNTPIDSWDALWNALADPCGLPDWFGHNLNAWNDTLGTGAISKVLDAHPFLIVQVLAEGMFAPDNPDGTAFVEVTAATGEGRVEVDNHP
jgi:hypothetical protein